jgi:hypothetical protein
MISGVFPINSFAAIASASVNQSGSSEDRYFDPIVLILPSYLALTGKRLYRA